MAKLRYPAHISDCQGIDITFRITHSQVDIAVAVSYNFFSYPYLKLILVFRIKRKQISVTEKLSLAPESIITEVIRFLKRDHTKHNANTWPTLVFEIR